MNWRIVSREDTPKFTDILLRIEEEEGSTTYLVGYINNLDDVCTKGKRWQFGGTHLCNLANYASIGIKSIHYIDPREILL